MILTEMVFRVQENQELQVSCDDDRRNHLYGSSETYNTVTDASGNYQFTVVSPGRYKIRFTTPAGGYHPTRQDAGFE
jgi:hypothetical protein